VRINRADVQDSEQGKEQKLIERAGSSLGLILPFHVCSAIPY
jgi:hypothetical protein